MIVVEDVDDGSLPSTVFGTDATNHRSDGGPRGAKKWEQLGVDAALKVLDSTIDGLGSGNISAVLVVDLHVTSGDLFEAFLIKKLSTNLPLYYWGVGEDSPTVQFVLKARAENVGSRVKAGTLKLPGVEYKDNLPSDLVETMPERPELQCLVWADEEKTLKVPQEVLSRWGAHREFAVAFAELMQKAQSDLNYDVPLQSTADAGRGKKRPGDTSNAHDAKRAKAPFH